MSKVFKPLFSFSARGTLAKALTFRRRGQQVIAETKPIPKDAKTSSQLAWRTMYQLCTDLWHTLSAAEKQTWETQARRQHMTGYNYYMSLCLKPNPGIYLPLAGGTMSGEIDMVTNKIVNLKAPTNPNDAARLADAGGGTGKKIQDADGDTSWDTEETADKDEIQGKVKGVEFFRGHDDGIITLAKQSAVSAYQTSDQAIPNHTSTRINYHAKVFDVQSEFNLATDRFTAQKAGKYLVIAYVTMKDIAAGKWVENKIYKNGVNVNTLLSYSSIANQWVAGTVLAIITLAATDYLEHYVRHYHGSSRDTSGTLSNTWVQVAKIL